MAEVSNTELQTQLLKILVDPTFGDRRIGRGQSYLSQALVAKFPSDSAIRPQQIMQFIWQLVSQGLAYIDFSQPYPENWQLLPTKAGAEAARDEALNPDNFGEYLNELVDRVPAASPTVLQYVTEAGNAYVCRCYFASTVMLGVASEAAFLKMARSFGAWLPEGQRDKFVRLVEDPRSTLQLHHKVRGIQEENRNPQAGPSRRAVGRHVANFGLGTRLAANQSQRCGTPYGQVGFTRRCFHQLTDVRSILTETVRFGKLFRKRNWRIARRL